MAGLIDSLAEGVRPGTDGCCRCWWPGDKSDYVAYHDEEWGVPVADDHRLFEKICLEGFQSGLSWLTILRKRENFRLYCRRLKNELASRTTTRVLGSQKSSH